MALKLVKIIPVKAMHKAQWLGETEGEMGLTRESKNGGD